MSTTLVTIPLDQLKPSKANMRKTDKLAGIGQLVASIAANGLLENLIVQARKKTQTFVKQHEAQQLPAAKWSPVFLGAYICGLA